MLVFSLIETHDQNYCNALNNLNVIETSSKNAIIKTNTHCYINRQSKIICKFGQIFRVPEVIHITCNMGARDLPGIHIRQILHAHVTTITCDMCYYYLDSNSNFISAQACTLRLVYAKHYHASPDSIKSSYIMNKIYVKFLI